MNNTQIQDYRYLANIYLKGIFKARKDEIKTTADEMGDYSEGNAYINPDNTILVMFSDIFIEHRFKQNFLFTKLPTFKLDYASFKPGFSYYKAKIIKKIFSITDYNNNFVVGIISSINDPLIVTINYKPTGKELLRLVIAPFMFDCEYLNKFQKKIKNEVKK